jgi:hypothetical protein
MANGINLRCGIYGGLEDEEGTFVGGHGGRGGQSRA